MVCSYCPTLRPIKKSDCELCGSVDTAQRHSEIPIGFCTHVIGCRSQAVRTSYENDTPVFSKVWRGTISFGC